MRFLPKTARKQARRNTQQSSLELVRKRVVSQEIRAKIKHEQQVSLSASRKIYCEHLNF